MDMLQSMTGFGSASIDSELGKISIDIKSLNSKTLDLNYSLNPMFRNIESDIRSILTTGLKRGKIDFKINFKIFENSFSSSLNHDVIKSYIKDLKEITPGTLIDDAELLKIAVTLPNSIENNRSEFDQKLLESVKELVKKTIKKVTDFRVQEGKSMELDLVGNIDTIQKKLLDIEELVPERMSLIKKRLNKKLESLKIEVDQNRFEQELIYYLEKIDINEEIVRLKNHLNYFKTTLNESQIEKGKKLTFISQEMGREINTIGSKSNNLPMQQLVVEMKNELEKIKEQLLNVL
ncbi:YicC family protein [Flavobacteriaceae bacterium]|nr:YicC family protein [Flavobacteriaceae bacterium]MDC1317500.1 YicC family protein [Flavobacteriaceae bacterium]